MHFRVVLCYNQRTERRDDGIAQLSEYSRVLVEEEEGEDIIDFFNRESEALQELIEAGLDSPTLKGYVWSSGIADGAAFYIVEKLRPLTLTHLQVGDAWQLPFAHIRGLNKQDLEEAKESDLKWRELFAKT